MATPTVKLFVLSHSADLLSRVPEDRRIQPLNLTQLELGEFQDNNLGEGRAFLLPYEDETAEIMGFANARWDSKYPRLNVRLARLPSYIESTWRPGLVMAPWLANGKNGHWFDESMRHHPTMEPLLYELAEFTGLDLRASRLSLWANDFVCSRDVFLDWHAYWHRCFFHFYNKYGFDLPFGGEGTDRSRSPAYFYERFTALYFANRSDLSVQRYPKQPLYFTKDCARFFRRTLERQPRSARA